MSNKDKEQQKIVDEAHTIEIELTEAAGGGKIVVKRHEDDSITISHAGTTMNGWPAPIAYMAGRMLMHMATQVDPSLEGKM